MSAQTIAVYDVNAGRLATPDKTQMAVAGYLARFRNAHTATCMRIDLKHFLGWCLANDLAPLQAERGHLDLYIQHLHSYVAPFTGRPYRPATINRKFVAVAGLYKYAHEEGMIDKNPAARVVKPKVNVDDQARPFLTPLEFAALLAEARKHPMDHCLTALLGMMGLRISEACSLSIETNLHTQGGYQVISFIGKGAKPATMPVPIPAIKAVQEAIGDRTAGPLLLNQWGNRMRRNNAARSLERIARAAGIDKPITPHALRRSFVTSGLLSGVPLRDMQLAARHADPSMTVRYDMMVNSLDRHASHRVASFLAGMAGA